MRGRRDTDGEENPANYAERLLPHGHEVWWYRQGVYIFTAIAAVVIWFVMIGPKEVTPKTEMVDPAIEALSHGVNSKQDLASLSKALHYAVNPPDLRQLGGKLSRASTAEFGGEKCAVFQYQYGKSVLLLYALKTPPELFKKMKQAVVAKSTFFISSGGPASVVAWNHRDHLTYALAANATEKDLLILAAKVAKAF